MMMFLMVVLLSLFMFILSVLGFNYEMNKEKKFSFECGFNPFVDSRLPFSIHFFKILLIFLLFDMEIIIILSLPFTWNFKLFSVVFIFLIMFFLIVGLVYEWKEGSLDWLY